MSRMVSISESIVCGRPFIALTSLMVLPLIALMACIRAAVLSCGLAKRVHFIGVGVGAWYIDEAGGEADGAVLHAFFDEGLHALDLVRRCEPVGCAHDLGAHRVVS